MKKAILSLLALVLLLSPTALLLSSCQSTAGEITPTVAQIELGGETGMAYIVQISDGRFIVIDGGVSRESTRERMLSYLYEKTNTEQPVIACWLFTHLDSDHFDNAYDFLCEYQSLITVQEFAYTFPERADFADLPGDSEDMLYYKEVARSCYDSQMGKWMHLRTLYRDATYWDMQANDKQSFADVKLHVLITANERIPQNVYTHNQRSAALQMTFTQGTAHTLDDTTLLVMGDCSGTERSEWMIETYGRGILKSDVLQVAHHGLAGGDKALYQQINPSICLWPTPEEFFNGECDFDGDGTPDDYQYCIDADYNQYLRSSFPKKRAHYHHSQTTVINMATLEATVQK